MTDLQQAILRIVEEEDEVERFMAFEHVVAHCKPEDQRRGQWALNMLSHVKPNLAQIATGSLNLDPFYNDEKLPAFWKFVEDNWL